MLAKIENKELSASYIYSPREIKSPQNTEVVAVKNTNN
jgi:hypothetical protein